LMCLMQASFLIRLATLEEEVIMQTLAVEIISNGTEGGVAPTTTFEFEVNMTGGTEPYIISLDFDDDESEESDDDEKTVLHTFEEAGTYNVNLTATDSQDQTASDSIKIQVEPAEVDQQDEIGQEQY
jgi:PKD repeat protein